ncbi:crotonase/enoyl-CoA hydratase family protein (plasmid) [Rhodococcus ruber]|uniref:crotonase/enoyl-CoA hydratase family protein n=1 Tax=Rhodococcus ruber TaxID=1830 RepID=UPI00265947F8|nr:crotonase/enoyl-CoA hydratase family protein [Rhodococcus ruber]WKK14855.1 crotonase/enoyl-CoA hydratase family protein [Rhodococcus ruber]
MTFQTIDYAVDGPIATITLNRPERLNALIPPMPAEIEEAVLAAGADSSVSVIVLRGAGRAFCAGFDFADGFHAFDDEIKTDGKWDIGKDFVWLTAPGGPVQNFMSLWRSPKPVIAMVHGYALGGGSELALAADLVIASDDACIGTPGPRLWGAYLTGLWIYRLGLTKAKEYGMTGRSMTGSEAAELGVVNKAVPFAELEATVRAEAEALATIPQSQLAANKLVINRAVEAMGLSQVQTMGVMFDGMMRNTPEALKFLELAETEGVPAASAARDRAFGDYSQAPAEKRPDPKNVIEL